MSGPIIGPSSYFFKSPPQQFRDDICREKVEEFIEVNGKPSRKE
jgi:myo-inositol-1-phosphate synthase